MDSSKIISELGFLKPRKSADSALAFDCPPEHLVKAAKTLRDSRDFRSLQDIAAIDMGPDSSPRFGAVYHFYSHSKKKYVRLVCMCADSARPALPSLCGVFKGADWHEREAYAWDVETTAYCAPDCIGQGVGGRLYRALIALLKKQGYYNAFALVTGSNCQSNNFHKALGFTKMGIEKRTGYKFGQWLDLDYWVLPLQDGEGEPQPVRKQLTAEEIAEALK